MLIGASPCGTGGGIKSTSLAMVLGLIHTIFTNKKNVELLNKQIPIEKVMVGVSKFILYIMLLFFSIFILSITEEQSIGDLFFESTAILGTAGLTVGVTDSLTSIGKIFTLLLMYVARIGPLNFAKAFSYEKKSNQKVYNREDLLV